jgi:hypothetical protein
MARIACGVFDAGDDLHLAAALDAGFYVDAEDALEALCPGRRAALLVGRSIIRVGGFTRRIAAFAALRWRELRAQVRVRGKDAVEAGQVRARRHMRCAMMPASAVSCADVGARMSARGFGAGAVAPA